MPKLSIKPKNIYSPGGASVPTATPGYAHVKCHSLFTIRPKFP